MISIIIPTYKEEGYIEENLKNLKRISGIDYEIIVSDSQSPDRTAEIAKRYADKVVEMPQGRKRCISQGKNDGASIAKGEYLVFMDTDATIPEPNEFFKKLLGVFSKDPELLALTVPIWVKPELARWLDKFFFTILNSLYALFNNVLHTGNASGEFQMMRASAFKKVSGYREDLAAGEDNDMFIRLSKLGKARSYTKLCVYHSGRRIHKVGWPKILYAWLKNGLSVLLFNKSAFKEWEAIR